MLADFHFLLGGVLFQALDAFLAALNRRRHGSVLLFELANLAALVEQCRNSLRSTQRRYAIQHDQRKRQRITCTAADDREPKPM